MTAKQRATLYLELSKLLGSGLHADRGIELLLEQRPATSIKKFLLGVQKGLHQKLGFTDAIRIHNQHLVTALETSLLAAGERGGRLEHACQHLANYFFLQQRSIDKIVGALIYPIILLHLGLVLPEFISFFSGVPLVEILQTIIPNLLLLWMTLVLLYVICNLLFKAAANSPIADRFLRLIPLVGSVNRHWALARFCQVFQTGLLAALNISETLKLSGDASQSALTRQASYQAAKKILNGHTLTDSLKSSSSPQTFPLSFIHSIQTAETTGTLDTEMGRWAQIEGDLAATQQDRLAEWLPRIFYFLIVLYIASRIISLFQGLYGEGSPINELLNAF